jgi:hypothetical protein
MRERYYLPGPKWNDRENNALIAIITFYFSLFLRAQLCGYEET